MQNNLINLNVMNIRKAEELAKKAFVVGCKMLRLANRRKDNVKKSHAMTMINRARKVLNSVNVRIVSCYAVNLLKCIKSAKSGSNILDLITRFGAEAKLLLRIGLVVYWDNDLQKVKIKNLNSGKVI